jgi:hypothetical protein
MTRLARAGAIVISVAAALVPATLPAQAGAAGARYQGTEYDQGGVTRPINGPLPQVDQLADQIPRSTEDMLREVAAERATLPYGRLDRDSHRPQLTTYPAPAGMTPSDQYEVTLRQGNVTQPSFVYKVNARKTDTNLEQDTSWTSFSFGGTVKVSVRKLQGDATGCLVRPESAGIHAHFADRVCSFTLTRSANVSVEFLPNTTSPVLHPMLVFANPPEADVPPADDPNVLYLGPGVHDLGAVQLHSNQTVYVAGGAWVQASFKGVGVHDVVIRGRGVIDGTVLDTGDQDANKNQPGLINIDCHEPGQVPHSACSPVRQWAAVQRPGARRPHHRAQHQGDQLVVQHRLRLGRQHEPGRAELLQGERRLAQADDRPERHPRQRGVAAGERRSLHDQLEHPHRPGELPHLRQRHRPRGALLALAAGDLPLQARHPGAHAAVPVREHPGRGRALAPVLPHP